MKTLQIISLLALLLLGAGAHAKTKVVAATSDLAWFASQIGGDLIEVQSIAPPKADIHFIEVRPSYMMKVAKADVVLKVGLELDMWMDRIIDGSRNSRVEIVDCSKYIKPLEVPSYNADARYGDIHRFGNPHYWLGPQNVKPISDAIVEGLSAADPAHADQFVANQKAMLAEIDAGMVRLAPKIAKLKGVPIVFYHDSWPYFNAYVGTAAADFIEAFPGVPPSPAHIKDVADLVKQQHIQIIAMEPYFDRRIPEKIAGSSGATVVTLYPSIDGRSPNETYVSWFEGNIDALLGALK